MRASDKRLLRSIGIVFAIVFAIGVMAFVVFLGWGMYHFSDGMGMEYRRKDHTPDAEEIRRLAKAGYPKPITRIFEAGSSSDFNGDGERLTIHCFPPDQVAGMKEKMWQPVGGTSNDWKPGLPSGGEMRGYIEKYAPPDLQIPVHASGGSFIHLDDPPFRYYIIDLEKGIGYGFVIQS